MSISLLGLDRRICACALGPDVFGNFADEFRFPLNLSIGHAGIARHHNHIFQGLRGNPRFEIVAPLGRFDRL